MGGQELGQDLYVPPCEQQSLLSPPLTNHHWFQRTAEVSKPKIIEDGDVILKVTGSTVCGSDLHLLHGTVVQLVKGDILGHEFCGVAVQTGPGVSKVKVGKRYVASFQIACGDCFFCKQKLSSQCEKTNSNTTAKAMYGSQTAGIFGYSHFTGGFAGGQAEYVRVPIGDVNLLELPDDVPDEKGEFLNRAGPPSTQDVTSNTNRRSLSLRRPFHLIQRRQRHRRLPQRRGSRLRRRPDRSDGRSVRSDGGR